MNKKVQEERRKSINSYINNLCLEKNAGTWDWQIQIPLIVSLFEATALTRHAPPVCLCVPELTGRGPEWVLKRLSTQNTVTFLKYNCWQFLFEMSQIRNINFSAIFQSFLRNITNKKFTYPPLQYFVKIAHFFLFMSRVISIREIFCFC